MNIFLLGAPRSGTTWVQRVLAAHPDIASPQETSFFSRYLAPLDLAWKYQMSALEERSSDFRDHKRMTHRVLGLPTVLDERQFNRLMVQAFEGFRDQILALKPGSTVLLEKTPVHTLHIPLIRQVVPHARFIHVIRDPRTAVGSLLDAGRSWGSSWAPKDAYGAALLWRQHVEAGLGSATLVDRYLEVRYERMLENPAVTVASLLKFIELDGSPEELLAIVESERGQTTSELVLGGEAAKRSLHLVEPQGFDKRSRGNHKELSEFEEWIVDRTTADLSEELGYRQRPSGSTRVTMFSTRLILLRANRQVKRASRGFKRTFLK